MTRLTIGHLYPDLLNLYGDRGNVECLRKRCEWRGIEVEIVPITIGTPIVAELTDRVSLLFMGGGEDSAQKKLYDDFINHKKNFIHQYIESGGVGLFICGGYQLLGKYYRPYSGADINGLNIIDLHTKHFGRDKKRCVGNVVCEITGISELTGKQLVGFENHGGRTFLDEATKPLGKIISGCGNNCEDKSEGVIYKNCIGAYLHGPLLPKNPHLADYLIEKALQRQYKQEVNLEPLDDDLEWSAHQNAAKLRP